MANAALGNLRLKLGERFGLIDEKAFAPLWVTDFPLLEYDPEDKRWVAKHHPFTSPQPGQMETIASDPGGALARAYDLVLNGSEIGGGSIRIHTPAAQKAMFQALGIGDEEAEEKFGFLIEALKFGAPPHGGIAFGLDRIIMILTGAKSIRDVIAFPKTQKATCLMTEAPNVVGKSSCASWAYSLRESLRKPRQSRKGARRKWPSCPSSPILIRCWPAWPTPLPRSRPRSACSSPTGWKPCTKATGWALPRPR